MNVIYFDGVCNLCNGFVSFVFNNSKKGTFYFSPLQKSDFKIESEAYDTVIVKTSDEKILVKADAIRYILVRLHWYIKWMGWIAYLLPNFILNKLYDAIAKRRYRLFGKKDVCRLPDENEAQYFV